MKEKRRVPERRISERRSFEDRRRGVERLFAREGHTDEEITREAAQWVRDMDRQLDAERRARGERREGADRRNGNDRRRT